MSQSSALWVEPMEDAARIADVGMIVLARFVEAADTVAHMDVRLVRPGQPRTIWPEHWKEHPENMVSYRPSRAAISRYEEVMHDWLPGLIRNEEQRVLAAKYAMCLAAPGIAGSWRKFCKESGRNRSTADARRLAAFQSVAGQLIKNAQLLRDPDWSRVMPMLPKSAIDLDRIRDRASEADRPPYWRAEEHYPLKMPLGQP
ncbi:hypothetical protein [Georhizobium sp. MAB10]|uniref:hypothetical protein n=1 Tax=Georhizobium sp. MAB10 TaxID=3028319 RepID=UPI003855C1CF